MTAGDFTRQPHKMDGIAGTTPTEPDNLMDPSRGSPSSTFGRLLAEPSALSSVLGKLSQDLAEQRAERTHLANAITMLTRRLCEISEEERAGRERLTHAIEKLAGRVNSGGIAADDHHAAQDVDDRSAPDADTPKDRSAAPSACIPLLRTMETPPEIQAACSLSSTSVQGQLTLRSATDSISRTLRVTIVQARQVCCASGRETLGPAMAEPCDAYCQCYVHGKPGSGFQTPMVRSTDPVWNHTAVIDGWRPEDSLVFEVKDQRDWPSSDALGTAKISQTWGHQLGKVLDGELHLAQENPRAGSVHSLWVRIEVAEDSSSPRQKDCKSTPAELAPPLQPRYLPHNEDGNSVFWLPLVQVGVKIYRVGSVDTSSMTFEADFTVHLDWRDDSLTGYVGELTSLDWERKFFNPIVYIHNAKQVGDAWQHGYDKIPRWYPSAGSKERRLRKTLRFKGTLFMEPGDLSAFPYDLQILPIKLKARPCRGLGEVLRNGDGSKANKEAYTWGLKDSEYMQSDKDYLMARHKGNGQFCSDIADEMLMEFNVRAVGGRQRHEGYQVNVMVERPLASSYTWHLISVNVLHCLAFFSFWDQVSPDLSSRLSITLTVALTIAASSSVRPAAIKEAPHVTVYDWSMYVCIASVTFISVGNIVSVTCCGGHHTDAPGYLRDVYERYNQWCGYSWCGSNYLDCHFLLAATFFYLCLFSLILIYRRKKRYECEKTFVKLGILEHSPVHKPGWAALGTFSLATCSASTTCETSHTKVVPVAN